MLGRWKKQFEDNSEHAFPGKGELKPQDEEVARLMSKNNIKAKQKRKYKATTNSNHNHPVNPDLLQRKFDAETPNQKWLADITCIPSREDWLYLAAILDLYSKMIVGWSMSSRMTEKLVSFPENGISDA